uniref:Uncharacterized protein n=1 Tax=viral metagenome TaxID=1070528 RepID=A0A6M3IYJ8_9ZZZZ
MKIATAKALVEVIELANEAGIAQCQEPNVIVVIREKLLTKAIESEEEGLKLVDGLMRQLAALPKDEDTADNICEPLGTAKETE